MEYGEVISVDADGAERKGVVRVGGSMRRVDLPEGIKAGDLVTVNGRKVERRETRAFVVPEAKWWS